MDDRPNFHAKVPAINAKRAPCLRLPRSGGHDPRKLTGTPPGRAGRGLILRTREVAAETARHEGRVEPAAPRTIASGPAPASVSRPKYPITRMAAPASGPGASSRTLRSFIRHQAIVSLREHAGHPGAACAQPRPRGG